MADVNGTSGAASRAYLKLAAFAVLIVSGLLLARFTPLGSVLTQEGIGRAIGGLRGSVWAPLLFIAVYAGASAMAIPGTILTLAGGAIFGLFWGTILNSIAANIGANLAFLIARFLGREGIERLFGGRLERLDEATNEHGFRGLLLLRLVPLVPFNALNFGSGLTALRWRTYATATVVGIFPGTVVYTMFADALLQGSQEASREALVRVLISGVLLISLTFLPAIMRKINSRSAAYVPFLVGLVLAPGFGSAQTGKLLPDHSAFSQVLAGATRGSLVDYQALRTNRAVLDTYLETLERTDPGVLAAAPHSARLAFWINAYNACMLRQVVDHYPIQKNSGLLSRATNAILDRPENSVWQIADVFKREHCTVAGQHRSQDQIEHEIIRPMGDPRIHFAVNCAAMSCPPLQASAFTAADIDAQLDAAVRKFMADSEHFQLTADASVLKLNKVLDWYGDDFGGRTGLLDFFGSYLEGQDGAQLSDQTRVEFFEYDWTLNDIPR